MKYSCCFLLAILASAAAARVSADDPTREEAEQALAKAVRFFSTEAATDGGYVWIYSDDLKYRQGEGLAYDRKIWIQPPGTPAVGMAMLDVHETTGDTTAARAAVAAARALVEGQLHSGGWYYYVTFDPEDRRQFNYRRPPSLGKPPVDGDADSPGGWDEWRKRKHKENITLVDDDVTPAALRLLMRVDKAGGFRDADIHEAAEYGLASLMAAQHPIGAWSHNYDRFPRQRPDVEHYPIRQATVPDSWSRTWTKDFQGGYVINDRITLNALKTFLLAADIYGKDEYRQTALAAGEFLLLAQLPEPQPAWAQQYNRQMQPVWDRAFEPPAITALESQDAAETLLLLYESSGEKKFLDAAQRAIEYLRGLTLDDGKLARFYELKTDRPLYFTEKYQITYDRGKMPDHYGFIVESRLAAIAKDIERLRAEGPAAGSSPAAGGLAAEARKAIDSMDARGAWLEPGFVRDEQGRKVTPERGVIRSETFIYNVSVLCRYLQQTD